MLEYFDRHNNPIDYEEWIRLFSKPDYKRVKLTELHDGTRVSTVWLGMKHGHGPNGPYIFETMVFHKDSDEQEQCRYATEEEALKHHNILVGVEEPLEPPSRWWQIMNEEE